MTGLSVSGSTAAFTGGSGKWATVGGDFVTASNSGMDFVDVSFSDGDEDIEVDNEVVDIVMNDSYEDFEDDCEACNI